MISKYPARMRYEIETKSSIVFSEINDGFYECIKNRDGDTEGELLDSNLVTEVFNLASSVSIKLQDGSYISTLTRKGNGLYSRSEIAYLDELGRLSHKRDKCRKLNK